MVLFARWRLIIKLKLFASQKLVLTQGLLKSISLPEAGV